MTLVSPPSPSTTLRMSLSEFERYAELPENAEKRLEYIAEEVHEVPSNPYSSKIALRVAYLIGRYLEQNDSGHLTGEGGGYQVHGQRYAPDVAYISYARQPELARRGYNPQAPDLAVEVISPTDEDRHIRLKIVNYLAAGTVVWVIDPEYRSVEIYRPGLLPEVLEGAGDINGDPVLPGLRIPLSELLPASPPSE